MVDHTVVILGVAGSPRISQVPSTSNQKVLTAFCDASRGASFRKRREHT
jgi:hypothetical protein